MQSWVRLIELRQSCLVHLAEYAKLYNLEDEPALTWWIPFALKKRDQIISSLKARVKKKTKKYDISIPSTVEETYELYKRNGDSYWKDAVKKEMKNIMIAFKVLDSSERALVGHSRLKVHLVFDIKLGLTRNARLVADGRFTPDLMDSTYVGVVSRETVRIALTYTSNHGLDLWAAEVMTTFVQAATTEKYFIECGPEFGS